MNYPIRNLYALVAVAVGGMLFLGLMGAPNKAIAGCGIGWEVPGNHFDGINEIGELSYWREVGKVDLGDGLRVPLIIGFKPKRGSDFWLGPGWIIPILEANIVQIDERKFLLTQPDGITRQFLRKNDETDTVLVGQGEWAGKINGNLITLWATCGWRLTFSKGKLITITTPKNRILNVGYVNGRPTEIQERGRRLLRVESDATGKITGLTFRANRVVVKLGERPQVNVIPNVNQDVNVIGGTLPALQTLILQGDGYGAKTSQNTQIIYEFGVDEKVQPTLHISDASAGTIEHRFTWNAATGRLIKDGEWTYDIKPGKNWWWNAAIGRTNTKGQREFWHEDKLAGTEITETLDGKRREVRYFASGILEGQKREIKEIVDGKTTVLYHASYNENGMLLKEVLENGRVNQYTYNESGEKVKAEQLKDGKIISWQEYVAEKLSAELMKNGQIAENFYDAQGRFIKRKINGKLFSETIYAENGSWKKSVVFNLDLNKPEYTLIWKYNGKGQNEELKHINHIQNTSELVWKYVYDDLGRLVQESNTEEGIKFYTYTNTGKRVLKKINDELSR